jgi:hypothetical protein
VGCINSASTRWSPAGENKRARSPARAGLANRRNAVYLGGGTARFRTETTLGPNRKVAGQLQSASAQKGCLSTKGIRRGSFRKLMILLELTDYWYGRAGPDARKRKGAGWHSVASGSHRGTGIYSKAVELAAPKTSLTPCILDQDRAQLDLLSAAMEDMGYEAITTSDPEEVLGLVRSGRCWQM